MFIHRRILAGLSMAAVTLTMLTGLFPAGGAFSEKNVRAEGSRSLDQREREEYLKPGPSPMDAEPEIIVLGPEEGTAVTDNRQSLDGIWEMAEGGKEFERLSGFVLSADSYADLAGKAFDKDVKTLWASAPTAEEHWLAVDLGTAVAVNAFRLTFPEGKVAAAYDIQASADGSRWITLKAVEGNTAEQNDWSLDNSTAYTHYRVRTDGPLSVAEWSLARESQVNLALNRPVWADSYLGGNTSRPEFAVDGKWAVESTDGWVADGNRGREHWLVVDLGQRAFFDRVGVYSLDANGLINAPYRLADWQIEICDDYDPAANSGSWHAVGQVTGNTESVRFEDLAEPVAARYVRMVITNPGADNYARLFEFEVISNQREEITLSSNWDDAIEAEIPGSIHTALMNAGVIGDPYDGMNDSIAHEQSGKTWWLRTAFEYSGDGRDVGLHFGGVCDQADFWLNGRFLGSHQGMFGGPDLDVSGIVKQGENELVVRLNPAVYYQDTVIFSCSDGWHYAKLWPLGIWNTVYLEEAAQVTITDPFIAAKDVKTGTMDLSVELKGLSAFSGTLKGTVRPKNFEGETYSFSYAVDSDGKKDETVRLQFDIPDPRLWWPNNYGEQNLYWLELAFEGADGRMVDTEKTSFGIRTIEMAPTPEGEREDKYNWTFVINGEKLFLKGSNWCTNDALMRFTKENYDLTLSRAHEQGVQLLRSWGGGMPETDVFYDLCDEYGIAVYQEWPTAWDSYTRQPAEVLYETVERNTRRLRNRPSLIMWGGGNEGAAALTQPVLNNMGRLTLENDGTRPWHRQDPYGANTNHHYNVYWNGFPLDTNLSASETFIGEFGLPSFPNRESMLKYATEEEIAQWPIQKDGTVMHHTPFFGGAQNPWASTDVDIISGYAKDFIELDSVESLITGSQLAQTVGMRHTLDLNRTLWPNTTGICYYKINDIYPAESWGTVDWYGAPKIAYYFFQDAYEPLTAVGIFNTLTPYGNAAQIPIWLLDDTDQLADSDWAVNVRAYDCDLRLMKEQVYNGSGTIGENGSAYTNTKQVGTFELTAEQTKTVPLFLVTEVVRNGRLEGRNYYFVNYSKEVGALFELPRARVEVVKDGLTYTFKNVDDIPAAAVYFNCSDTTAFHPEDNYFWLEPGETKTVTVNDDSTVLKIDGWNLLDAGDTTPPEAAEDVKANALSHQEVELTWAPGHDGESGVDGYEIYRDGVLVGKASAKETRFVDTGLKEQTTYSYVVRIIDKGYNYTDSEAAVVTTLADTKAPRILQARLEDTGTITLTFDKPMDRETAENAANYRLACLTQPGAQNTVVAVELSADGRTASLYGAYVTAREEYVLWIAGVSDDSQAGNMLPDTRLLLESGLEGAWTMEEGEGDALRDYSGNAGNLGIAGADWISGGENVGSTLHFADGTQYAAGLNNTDLTGDFTLFMRVNPDAVAQDYNDWRVLIAKGPKDAGHFELYITPQGYLEFYAPDLTFFGTASADPHVLTTDLTLKSGQWQDVGIVRSGSRFLLYLDGRQMLKTTVRGQILREEEQLLLGRLAAEPSCPLIGSVGPVRLYSKALTPERMAALSGGEAVSVLLKPQTLTLKIGETAALEATTWPEASGEEIVWRSLSEETATVDQNGVVTAIAEGTTVIQATFRGQSAGCRVTVLPDGTVSTSGETQRPTSGEPQPSTSAGETGVSTQAATSDAVTTLSSTDSAPTAGTTPEPGQKPPQTGGMREIGIVLLVCGIATGTLVLLKKFRKPRSLC